MSKPAKQRGRGKAKIETSAVAGLPARQFAATILARIIDDGRGLDGLLETRHGPSGLGDLSSADHGLVRAIATTALRHRGEIAHALRTVSDRPPPKRARHLEHTLHVAAAQILFMEVPDSAAVDLAVTALKRDERSQRFSGFANAILRRVAREKDALFDGLDDDARALLNMPSWLAKRTRKAFGRERLTTIARAHMQEPVLDLTVKQDADIWAEKLGGVSVLNCTVRLLKPGALDTFPGYEDGAWWVQDVAASIPARLFGNVAGKRVLDLCAAPGGKTAQLAAAGAKVTALEASKPRLERLKANMKRLGLDIEAVNADLFGWEPEELFDAVLLDAPCSSLGTIRRHPDVQWTKTSMIVEELALLQKRMICRAQSFVKPGGTLVFANCSLDRAEGEDVAAAIASGDTGLRLDVISDSEIAAEFLTGQGTVRTLPCHLQDVPAPENQEDRAERFQGLDGFFAARFIREE